MASRAVVSEPSERRRIAFLNRPGTIRNDKKATRAAADATRRADKAKKEAKIAEGFAVHVKAEKKRTHRAAGMETKAKKSKH